MSDAKGLELDLDAIEKRAAEATPGPWEVRSSSIAVKDDKAPYVCTVPGRHSVPQWATWMRCNGPFIAAARTDVPALVAALREARARAEAAEVKRDEYLVAHVEDIEAWSRSRADLRAKLAVAEARGADYRDEWKCHRVRCANEKDALAKERDDARSTVEAAGRYMHGLDETIARAERAEAAAAQMRAALEELPSAYYNLIHGYAPLRARDERMAGAWKAARAALATDAGRGWVSPELHAEVVRERDEARRITGEYLAAHFEDIEAWSKLRAALEKAEARVAEVVRERDEARDAQEKTEAMLAVSGNDAVEAAVTGWNEERSRADRAEARVALLERVAGRAKSHLEYAARVIAQANVAQHVDSTWGSGSARNIAAGARSVVDEIEGAIDAAPTSGKRGDR